MMDVPQDVGTNMKKRMTIMLLALAIVFGGLIAYNLIKELLIKRFFSHFEPPAVTVSSVVAKKRDWNPYIHSVGSFVAINGVNVNSQAPGNVVAIHFHSGQFAEANQPLIDIDDSIDQAVQKSNQAELTLQQINFQRQTDLFKRGASAISSLDAARAKLLQAQAAVEKTEAAIKQKHIKTPFAGQLGIRQIDLGQYIMQGQTSIVSLQSMDPLYLKFYLPEQLLHLLHINQVIYFSVEQNPDLLFEGKISAINSKVDTKSHNVQVQATLANCPADAMKDPSHSLLIKLTKRAADGKTVVHCDSKLNEKNKIEHFNFIPGMFADIEVEQPVINNSIVLPTTSISYSLYGNSIYIIEKDSKQKDALVVKRVFVSTGDQQGNYTIIKSGVKEGQLVVHSGELKLQNGTRVTINNQVELKDDDPSSLSQ